MAKLTLTSIANLLDNPTSAQAAINANNALIVAAIENTLSRDGTSPNTMSDNHDMNSNKIVNLATPTSANDAVTKAYVDGLTGVAGVIAAQAAQAAAEAAQAAAETAETNAAASATTASTAATNASAAQAAAEAAQAAAEAAAVGAVQANGTVPMTAALRFTEAAAPGTPASGLVSLYAKTDGKLYSKDDVGAETALGGGAAAAPVAISSADTLDNNDNSALIVLSGTTFTLGISAISGLDTGWFVRYTSSATGLITVDPNSTEQINGANTYDIRPGDSGVIFKNGSAFTVVPDKRTVVYSSGASGLDTTTTAIPYDNTVPLVSEGKEASAVSNVRVKAGETVEVQFSVGSATCNTAGAIGTVALFRDSTCIGVQPIEQVSGVNHNPLCFDVVDNAVPAGTYTYSARFGPSSGGVTMQLNSDFSSTALYGNAMKTWLIVRVHQTG